MYLSLSVGNCFKTTTTTTATATTTTATTTTTTTAAAAAAAATAATKTTTATTILTFYCYIANCYNGNSSKVYSTLDKNNIQDNSIEIPSSSRTAVTKLLTKSASIIK
ncbi:hypothetical protein PoB_004699500, partial [Plakobranchus ocellatus]